MIFTTCDASANSVAAIAKVTRAVRVIRILLVFERGLVVVAIAEDRSGYVVGMKIHDSPQLHSRFKKPIAIPVDLKPRYRDSDSLGGKPSAHLHPKLPFATTAANGRDGRIPAPQV
jgi:hypothetical protein